jgi:predicted dienelactone hydrolase
VTGRLAIAAMLAAAAGMAWFPARAADAIGVRAMSVLPPEREQVLTVAIWYPAGAGGAAESVGESQVFEGIPARHNADIADGSFPIVLLSHGGLRAAPNQSGWIASRLAAIGFIVAAVPPPRPVDSRAAVAEIWLRPADLSATLTALLADPATAVHAALGQTAAVGFFLGGTAALALAGAELDAEDFARSCDPPATGVDCAWLSEGGVDLRDVDGEHLTRSALDPRIGTVVAIDPELTAGFSAESLSKIDARVAILNLGHPDAVVPEFDASGLLAAIPGATYTVVPEATPFSAMAVCRPQGAAILLDEGEDATICAEPPLERERIHARLAAMIADRLGRGR